MSDMLKQLGKEIEDLKRIGGQLKKNAHAAQSNVEADLLNLDTKLQKISQDWKDLHQKSGHEHDDAGSKIKEMLKSLRNSYQQIKKKM